MCNIYDIYYFTIKNTYNLLVSKLNSLKRIGSDF